MGIDPVTATIGATIVGAGTGIYGANKAAKAQKSATAAQMAPFNLKKPYLEGLYSGVEGAGQAMLDAHPYTGPTTLD